MAGIRWPYLSAISLVIVTLVILTASPAFAQGSFSVTPVYIEQNVSPGANFLGNITVTNEGDETKHFEIIVAGYGQDLSGLALPLGSEEDVSSYTGRELVTVSPSVLDIPPRQSRTVSSAITIPDGAEGGRYALILVRIGGEGEGGVVMYSQIAVSLRLTIAGSTLVKNGTSGTVEVTQEYAQEPITFLTPFTNTGNVHFRPTGEVIIRTEAGEEFNRQPILAAYVIPGYTRQLRAVWQPEELPVGSYTVESVITLEDDTILSQQDTFTVIEPYRVEGAQPSRPTSLANFLRANWYWIAALAVLAPALAEWGLRKVRARSRGNSR